MFKQLGKNVWATRVFFFVRFVASCLVGLCYILIAAAVQDIFVKLLGENTFNYIVGGFLSLMVGIVFCSYGGRIIFLFVRGWHMSALAYAKKIEKRNLSALDVGMRVFKRHLGSFAIVYGCGALVKKYAGGGMQKLWKLLKDVPYLGSFVGLSDNVVVRHIGADLLDTGFDACIYYVVRYTKEGIGDDLEAVPDAMRRYLYALPNVMLSSLMSYFLLYFVPKVLKYITVVCTIFSQGLVAGILINVLLYPMFYIMRHSIFEPLETIIMMSAYSKHCMDIDEIDEDDTKGIMYRNLVDEILSSIGMDRADEDDEEAGEEEEIEEEIEEAPKEKLQKASAKQSTECPQSSTSDIASLRDALRNGPTQNVPLTSIPLEDTDEGGVSGGVERPTSLHSLAEIARSSEQRHRAGQSDAFSRRGWRDPPEVSDEPEVSPRSAATIRRERMERAMQEMSSQNLQGIQDVGEPADSEVEREPEMPPAARLSEMMSGPGAQEFLSALSSGDDEDDDGGSPLGGGDIDIM